MSENASLRTVTDFLLRLESHEDLGARFVTRTLAEDYYPYPEVLRRAQGVVAAFQHKGLQPGDRVAIVLPTSIEFLDTFLGIQLAGGIPTALYPPVRIGGLDQYLERTAGMLRRVGTRYLITDERIGKFLDGLADKVPSLEEILIEQMSADRSGWRPVDVDPDSPAFLQFTSGSTAAPKAVEVSHKNLLANLEMLHHQFAFLTPEENRKGGVCWLPLYHDMGLVGCMLYGMYHPGTMTYIRPDSFVAKPQIWLQALSRYKAVASPAPNFAYELCLCKVKDEHLEGADLSNWYVAMNGAEPINVDVMNGFIERFSHWGLRRNAMTPVYGMAETVLATSFSEISAEPVVAEFDAEQLATNRIAVPGLGRKMASVGTAVPGLEIESLDDKGAVLPEGRVGRIAVRGPSVARGYYGEPEVTRKTFALGQLDTGDLGFFHQGALYISGRAKDLLIIRGRNIAPQELEELVTDIEGMRSGRVVVVGAEVDGHEEVVVLAERQGAGRRDDEELKTEIKDRILAGAGLKPYQVCILKPGTLPRTSSGKLRRSAALEMYQDNDFGEM